MINLKIANTFQIVLSLHQPKTYTRIDVFAEVVFYRRLVKGAPSVP